MLQGSASPSVSRWADLRLGCKKCDKKLRNQFNEHPSLSLPVLGPIHRRPGLEGPLIGLLIHAGPCGHMVGRGFRCSL
jgi:hypothetical protein